MSFLTVLTPGVGVFPAPPLPHSSMRASHALKTRSTVFQPGAEGAKSGVEGAYALSGVDVPEAEEMPKEEEEGRRVRRLRKEEEERRSS